MKRIMKYWWLIALALLLIVAMTFRESFVSYADALRDVGQTSGYTSLTPKCPEGSALNTEKTMCKFTDTRKADVVPTCSSDTLEFVGGTCRAKPGSASTTGTGTTGAATSTATSGTTAGTTSGTTAGTTAGTTGMTDAKCADNSLPDENTYICQSTGLRPICPAGSTLYNVIARGAPPKLKCVQNSLVYDGSWPDGERTQAPCRSPSHGAGIPIPPSGNPPEELPKCIAISGGASGNTNGSTPGTTTPPATASGGVAPTSVRKNTILGPVFTSYGAPIDGNGPDSYKSNQYPELLGGGDPVSRNRETGAGGAGGGFGMSVDLKGSMPTMDGLGATEQSKFFPFSRQPGDMELIPDPYRVSQQFSSASYSFKTEPTPFLTDFSAFLR